MTSVHTNNGGVVCLVFVPEFVLGILHSKSGSKREMSSNSHRHRVRLAKKWLWICSECPKVPRMRRNDQKKLY